MVRGSKMQPKLRLRDPRRVDACHWSAVEINRRLYEWLLEFKPRDRQIDVSKSAQARNSVIGD